jgi:hypothetical protein
VTDGVAGSMAVIVAVIVRWVALGTAGSILIGRCRALYLRVHFRLAGVLQPDHEILVIPSGHVVADLDLRERG